MGGEVPVERHVTSLGGQVVPTLGSVRQSIQNPIVLTLLCLLAACVSNGVQAVSTPPDQLLERADQAFAAGASLKAQDAYQLAALAARTTEEDGYFREATAMVAALHSLGGRPEEAAPWLSQAEIGATPSEPRAWTRLLLARGAIARAQGNRAAALQQFDNLYRYALEAQLFGRALQAGSMALLVSPPEQQVQWAMRGVEGARAAGQPRWEAAALNSLAWTFEARGEHAQALGAFRSSHRLYGEHGKTRERLKADWCLAHGLRMAGEVGTARALQERVLRAALSLQNRGWSPNDSEWVARSQEEMAELEFRSGRLTSALKHLAAANRAYILAEAEVLAPDRLAAIKRRSAEMQAFREGRLEPNPKADAKD